MELIKIPIGQDLCNDVIIYEQIINPHYAKYEFYIFIMYNNVILYIDISG